MKQTNNKRIIKNTIMLYLRMVLIMLVTLYTSRIILNALGVEDYGLYNVVGGIVFMLSFLNNAMATSTQRFFNFEMGQKNYKQLKRVFSLSVTIHLIIAIVIFLLLETIGIWFIKTQLNIPYNRIDAVVWVFHFSAASLLVTIAAVPFFASIIAHERMVVFAYIGIIEVFLKLLVAFIIQNINTDPLKTYALLLFGVTSVIQFIYFIYARLKFEESKFYFYWDSKLFKTLISFAGWNLFGSFAVVMKNQGVNVLLNIFFGPVVNAAKGISTQVNGALTSFVTNFQTALKPQMIKSYAAGDIKYHLQLVFKGAKYSFFLLFFLSLPILLETETILKLWLKKVPEYTTIFVRLVILSALIDSLTVTLIASIQATGKVKKYQIAIGFLHLSIFPISYLFFKLGFSPEATYYIALVIYVLILLSRLILVRKQIKFSIYNFFKRVIFKVFIVSASSVIIPLIVINNLNSSFTRLSLVIFISLISTLISVYFLGTNKDERNKINENLKIMIKKLNKNLEKK